MTDILVYQDYIQNNGVLFRRLGEIYGANRVGYCDADDILNGCLNAPAPKLFIMPGGADLFYCEKLNGAGNQAIRAYVETGGTYLGICAGAYYACRRIEWATRDKAEAICGERELGFFPGTAIGPLYDFLEDSSIDKCWHNIATLHTAAGQNITCMYQAGPVFVPDADATGYKPLATYQLPSNPLAAVHIKIGQGQAILSSCHPEYTPDNYSKRIYHTMNPSHAWMENVANSYRHNPSSATLWDALLSGITL